MCIRDRERTPSIPSGSGLMIGLNGKTLQSDYMIRAAVEGVTMGMNFGLNRLRELGVTADEVRLTGGGSRNEAWRRIIADVFGTPAVCMREDEGAALGAALQSAWCVSRQSDPQVSISSIVEGAVELDESSRVEPEPSAVEFYQELQAFRTSLSKSMEPLYEVHSRFKS